MNNVHPIFGPILNSICPPAPVMSLACPSCYGTGWRETRIDSTGLGHGGECIRCHGTGFIEVPVTQPRRNP